MCVRCISSSIVRSRAIMLPVRIARSVSSLRSKSTRTAIPASSARLHARTATALFHSSAMSNIVATVPAQAATPAAPVAPVTGASGPSPTSSLVNGGLASFPSPRHMLAHMLDLTSRFSLIRNYVGVVEDMSEEAIVVETELFPKDVLEFYSKYNLLLLDLEHSDRDKALHAKFYNAARGGGQGDYREGIQAKIANVVSCLRSFPNSKRAVLPVPHALRGSSTADHTDTDEAKCLRELHFHVDADRNGTPSLCCTGFMRAQAASIYPKNIHFIGSVMHHIAKQLQLPVGHYTHIVTTLVNER